MNAPNPTIPFKFKFFDSSLNATSLRFYMLKKIDIIAYLIQITSHLIDQQIQS